MKYTKTKYIFIYWYFSYKRKWFKFYSIQFFMEKLKMRKKGQKNLLPALVGRNLNPGFLNKTCII